MKPAIPRSFARGEPALVGGGDRREHHVPALEEQRVEDLLLGGEVVVDEAVCDPGLVGDVGDAAGVKALPAKTRTAASRIWRRLSAAAELDAAITAARDRSSRR